MDKNISAYIQKIFSALQGGGAVRVSSFVSDHILMKPVLHAGAKKKKPDMSAMTYSMLRLPFEILECDDILFGQSDRVFLKQGIDVNTKEWKQTKALARERKCTVNAKKKQLGFFITSVTDVEDIVTSMTALHIEIMKLHKQLADGKEFLDCFKKGDYEKVEEILGNKLQLFIDICQKPRNWNIHLLASSNVDYAKAVQEWWINIASSRKKVPVNVYDQPVYFVSSNSHSLINILSGFPQSKKKLLLKENADRVEENTEAFKAEAVHENDILNYLSRFSEKKSAALRKEKKEYEKGLGLYRIAPYHHIEIEAQIFSIKDVIGNTHIDSRLKISPAMKKKLLKSNALIVNIAYPLGMAAYRILKEVSENVPEMRGIYIMGKAAALNASVGDIMIPHYVYDHHYENGIFVYNDFNRDTFSKYVSKNSILDAQKAVTVRGTYLQNNKSLHADFTAGRTIVEMEAGPYLNRVFEMIQPERHPENDTFVVNTDFRLGLAYYVSDTPYRSEVNLGAKRLTWEGLNGTYAISLGIVQDILHTEYKRFS